MNYYHFFSDIIISDIDFPELMEEEKCNFSTGFMFRLPDQPAPFFPNDERVHHWRLPPANTITLSYANTKGSYLLDFPKVARFEIDKRTRLINGYRMTGTPVSTIRHLLLDQVLPRLFAHFYYYSVLHASCVEVEGKSICFLGDTGWGKSTLAAGFKTAGYPLMTDDCVQVCLKDGAPVAQASYHSVRLFPDSIEALNVVGSKDAKAATHYSAKKRFLRPAQTVTLPIGAFFIMTAPNQCQECSETEISSMSKTKAILELLKNSFCLDLHDNPFLQNQFQQISAITTSGIPVYLLKHPRQFEKLEATVHSILSCLQRPH